MALSLVTASALSPVNSLHDRRNGASGDAELSPCAAECGSDQIGPTARWQSLSKSLSNRADVGLRQLRAAMASSAQVHLTALGDFVRAVHGRCSKKQVVRIYAAWIVAAVQDLRLVWDRSIRHHPRGAVGALLAKIRGAIHLPVSVPVSVSCPQPAVIRTGDGCMSRHAFFDTSRPSLLMAAWSTRRLRHRDEHYAATVSGCR
jgi:hypothetical protein